MEARGSWLGSILTNGSEIVLEMRSLPKVVVVASLQAEARRARES